MATPAIPTIVADIIIIVAQICILLWDSPIIVLNIIFIGMKNCNSVINNKAGKTVAGQKSKNA